DGLAARLCSDSINPNPAQPRRRRACWGSQRIRSWLWCSMPPSLTNRAHQSSGRHRDRREQRLGDGRIGRLVARDRPLWNGCRKGAARVSVLTVYSKPDCHLCAEAMSVLRRLQGELGFVLQELDITADEALHRAYFERIPVVAIDGEELLQYFIDEAVVR